jgi:hypothetical protein
MRGGSAHEFIRLACDNRAGAQPLPSFGIFPVSQSPGKLNGPSSYIAIANGSFGLAILRQSYVPFGSAVYL